MDAAVTAAFDRLSRAEATFVPDHITANEFRELGEAYITYVEARVSRPRLWWQRVWRKQRETEST